jgi:hypothetical protein
MSHTKTIAGSIGAVLLAGALVTPAFAQRTSTSDFTGPVGSNSATSGAPIGSVPSTYRQGRAPNDGGLLVEPETTGAATTGPAVQSRSRMQMRRMREE